MPPAAPSSGSAAGVSPSSHRSTPPRPQPRHKPPERRTSPSATPIPPGSAPAATSRTAPMPALHLRLPVSRGPASDALDFRACSGATIDGRDELPAGRAQRRHTVRDDLRRRQRRRLRRRAHRVRAPAAPDCGGAIDQAQAYINNTLPGRSHSLYASIRAGRRRRGSSWSATRGSSWVRTATPPPGSPRPRRPASTRPPTCSTAAVARPPARASRSPTRPALLRARRLRQPRVDQRPVHPISESYHPNRAGHSSGYTPTVSPVLPERGAVTAATLAAPGGEQRRTRRAAAAVRHAGPPIEPRFLAPDLTSPQMRKAARQAGIDLDRWLAAHT